MSDTRPATYSRWIVKNDILYGADIVVAELVKSRIPHMRELTWGDHAALGVLQGGKLVGGVVFHCYRNFDICFGAAFDTKTWAKPHVLRELFSYPFGQLSCVRLTAITGRKNRKARALLQHLGFKFEGVARKALDGINDGYVYSLLKEECRWL